MVRPIIQLRQPLKTVITQSKRPFASTSKISEKLNPKPTPSHLTDSEQRSKDVEETGKPAQRLVRALGVINPPTKGKQSREEWRKDLIDQSKRLQERKHLVKQVATGYFHDYHDLRSSGGKSYVAPTTLIRADLSLYFPDIEGVSLGTKKATHTTDLFDKKISIVSMTSFKSSEEHVNSFVRPALADMEDDPLFQYIQINLQENPLKSFLVNLFMSSLRSTIPEKYHNTYLLSHQSLEYLREPMGMQNKHVGYVFLVDADKKIRWSGCAWATESEEESLRKCVTVLRDRLRLEMK